MDGCLIGYGWLITRSSWCRLLPQFEIVDIQVLDISWICRRTCLFIHELSVVRTLEEFGISRPMRVLPGATGVFLVTWEPHLKL